ncbi:MAG: FkbM family methyltransferase [Verrucomicrobiales bacterium]|nr:FkbM family methyltransferase [Verrucomicrobiota bacterium JB025]
MTDMNFEQLAREWLPPKLAWRVSRKARERRELQTFRSFYQEFLRDGDLCFDVGANLGNRTRAFRAIGCKVVAVEPQSACFDRLSREFGADDRVVLERLALGREPGSAEMQVASNHVLSSLSDTFVKRTTESGRFASARWNRVEKVEISTLDHLIERHGTPAFIKIDVEGFESEVIAGLTHPVNALSIEWVPEFPENAEACVRHLEQLGSYEFNISWGESMSFSKPDWRTPASMLRVIDEFRGESQLFGDIYARLKP